MNYTPLTQEERSLICTLLPEGFSKRYIALRLNRSPLTTSKEIMRNTTRNGYSAQYAHKVVDKVASRCHCPNPKRIPSDI